MDLLFSTSLADVDILMWERPCAAMGREADPYLKAAPTMSSTNNTPPALMNTYWVTMPTAHSLKRET